MERKALLELAKELSNAKGAPGFEDEAVAVLRRYAGELGGVNESYPPLRASRFARTPMRSGAACW